MDFSVIRRRTPPKKSAQPPQGGTPPPLPYNPTAPPSHFPPAPHVEELDSNIRPKAHPKNSSKQPQSGTPSPPPQHPTAPQSRFPPAPHVEELNHFSDMQSVGNLEYTNAGTWSMNHDNYQNDHFYDQRNSDFEYFHNHHHHRPAYRGRCEQSYHHDHQPQVLHPPQYHHALPEPPSSQDNGQIYYHDHQHQTPSHLPLPLPGYHTNRGHSYDHDQHQTPQLLSLPPPENHRTLLEYHHALPENQLARSKSPSNQEREHSYHHDHQHQTSPRLSLPPPRNHLAVPKPPPMQELPQHDQPQQFFYAPEPETCYFNPALGGYFLEENPNHCVIS